MNIVQSIIRVIACLSLLSANSSMVKGEDKVCNTSMFEHGMHQVLYNFFARYVASKVGLSLARYTIEVLVKVRGPFSPTKSSSFSLARQPKTKTLMHMIATLQLINYD